VKWRGRRREEGRGLWCIGFVRCGRGGRVDDRSFCERLLGGRVRVVGALCWRLCARGAPQRDLNLVVEVQLGRTLGIGAAEG